MYAVKSAGEIIGYSDTLVYIRLHKNGCYVPCTPAEAEGFCVKTAIDARTRRRARRRLISRTSFMLLLTADSSELSRSAPLRA